MLIWKLFCIYPLMKDFFYYCILHFLVEIVISQKESGMRRGEKELVYLQ